MKNIPIGSWKKHNDYAWFTGHGNSFHTPIVDEIELHKIAVLTDKKRPFYLTWNIAYPTEDFVEFNYIVRGDDEENRILLFIVLIKRL